MIEPSHKPFKHIPWIDQPYDRHQKGIEEEHHGFFLDHSVTLLVYVMEGDVLNQQSHECCSEEQAQSILQTERELVLAACSMLLDVCEDMQHEGQAKFVEEDDQQHCQKRCSKGFLFFNMGQLLIMSCLITYRIFCLLNFQQGRLDCMPLRCQDTIENSSDRSDEKSSQSPTYYQPYYPFFLWKVYVLPDDFFRLRCLVNFHVFSIFAKELYQFLFVQSLE